MTTITTTARSFGVKHKNPVVKSAYFTVAADGTILEGPKHLIETSTFNVTFQNFEFFFKDNFKTLLSCTVTSKTPVLGPMSYAWNNLGSGVLLAISSNATLVQEKYYIHFVFQDSTLPSKD